ncbi:MAG TPA: 23S rRNA (guanosine(2251)-2'-O)-methyltransferase RlmB [Acetobacteraceae bacterium]|nr:23S rRNA (guanosine(2251)-2'-O)-methyltransferase RlmB [Acetobacteraceae bacterium]
MKSHPSSRPSTHRGPPREGRSDATHGAGRTGGQPPSGPSRPPRPRPPHRPEPHADTPRGALWLYGLHAVAAALVNPARRLRRLVLTEDATAALAARLPRPWAITAETTDRARLDQLLGHGAVHQGAALLADPLAAPMLAQALERPGPVLVLDQVSDPRNVGAILRSAAAFGVAVVITQERHAPEETGSLAKAASGALESVPLLRAVNLARTLVVLKAAGLWVVGLDADAPARLSGPAFAERRVALVLGGEGRGLRRLTRESCDELAALPMPGGMESLNVSAAAAVALYELVRRT